MIIFRRDVLLLCILLTEIHKNIFAFPENKSRLYQCMNKKLTREKCACRNNVHEKKTLTKIGKICPEMRSTISNATGFNPMF